MCRWVAPSPRLQRLLWRRLRHQGQLRRPRPALVLLAPPALAAPAVAAAVAAAVRVLDRQLLPRRLEAMPARKAAMERAPVPRQMDPNSPRPKAVTPKAVSPKPVMPRAAAIQAVEIKQAPRRPVQTKLLMQKEAMPRQDPTRAVLHRRPMVQGLRAAPRRQALHQAVSRLLRCRPSRLLQRPPKPIRHRPSALSMR